jgi:hypothetical protein
MFAALVLAGMVAAPIGTICLLIQPSRLRQRRDGGRRVRRSVAATAARCPVLIDRRISPR